ncbi:MAG: cyclic nucleotide-binding domain-containing protein [Rhizobiales bacterium]|nr:cyclic nucleotide-binding domain-containing protein [Hyphomicrobiales bacterium]
MSDLVHLRKEFAGTQARESVLSALLESRLACQDKKAAAWLFDNGRVQIFERGSMLIKQGERDSAVYIVLSGRIQIHTNGNWHGLRGNGEHVGEMAALDRMPRSATCIADLSTAVLVLSRAAFTVFLTSFPLAALEVAKSLSARLRDRDKYFRVVNAKPKLFIICAKESKKLATKLKGKLKAANIEVKVWWADTIKPGDYTLPNLVEELNSCDFAVALAEPLDEVSSRDRSQY